MVGGSVTFGKLPVQGSTGFDPKYHPVILFAGEEETT
jgi:hypothetical protein